MKVFVVVAAIVAFAVAALLCFVGSISLLTIVGIALIGAALYAASALVTP